MSLAASCVSVALLVSAANGPVAEQSAVAAPVLDMSAPAIAASPQVLPTAVDGLTPFRVSVAAQPPWTAAARRPTALPAMYVSFGALQVLDVYSTRRAIARGAVEANPVMKGLAGNAAAMLAVKGAATAVSIYCAEKAWKRHRKAAIVLMLVLNGATAAVAAHNLHQPR
jgi:hypothetical protein